MKDMRDFVTQAEVLASYWLSSLLYPFFSVYIGIISAFKGYKWKGNYYRK